MWGRPAGAPRSGQWTRKVQLRAGTARTTLPGPVHLASLALRSDARRLACKHVRAWCPQPRKCLLGLGSLSLVGAPTPLPPACEHTQAARRPQVKWAQGVPAAQAP